MPSDGTPSRYTLPWGWSLGSFKYALLHHRTDRWRIIFRHWMFLPGQMVETVSLPSNMILWSEKSAIKTVVGSPVPWLQGNWLHVTGVCMLPCAFERGSKDQTNKVPLTRTGLPLLSKVDLAVRTIAIWVKSDHSLVSERKFYTFPQGLSVCVCVYK